MQYKQQLHALLDSVIHNCAKNSKSYKVKYDIPYYELCQELGFKQSEEDASLRVTILCHYKTNEESLYDIETKSSV